MNIDRIHQEEHPPTVPITGAAVQGPVQAPLTNMTATPEATIAVEMVADLFTDRRSRLRRGPVYWGWMVSSPVCGLILLAGLTNREPITVGLSVLALSAIYIMHRQADMLQQARTAL